MHSAFRARTTVESGSGCWVWQGRPSSAGYGRLTVGGRRVYAHRHSFELFVRPLRPGEVVDHVCFNRRCVNPAHLRAVSVQENIAHRQGAQHNSTTRVRGVVRHGPGWRAQANRKGKHYSAGTYPTVAEAAKAAHELRARLWTTANDSEVSISVAL